MGGIFHRGGAAGLRPGEVAAVLTPGAVSKNGDGWCGEPCPRCKGTGEVDTEHSYAACGRCGGTGERYESSLDLRDVPARSEGSK